MSEPLIFAFGEGRCGCYCLRSEVHFPFCFHKEIIHEVPLQKLSEKRACAY